MKQLRPTENFPIVMVLSDNLDTSTYYIQAIIKNSLTNTIIDTINLTDQGDRRFTKSWEVTPDISGEGNFIDITTTVYTDSGYTTKAGDYAEKLEQYLIQDRLNPALGGNGGGLDIDYKRIQRMIDSSIKSIPVVEIPEQIKTDLTPIENKVIEAISEIKKIIIPIPKGTDLTEIIKKIDITKQAINDKTVTEIKDLELSINKNEIFINKNFDLLLGFVKELVSEDKKVNNETLKEIKNLIVENPTLKLVVPAEKEKENEEKPKKIRNFNL